MQSPSFCRMSGRMAAECKDSAQQLPACSASRCPGLKKKPWLPYGCVLAAETTLLSLCDWLWVACVSSTRYRNATSLRTLVVGIKSMLPLSTDAAASLLSL